MNHYRQQTAAQLFSVLEQVMQFITRSNCRRTYVGKPNSRKNVPYKAAPYIGHSAYSLGSGSHTRQFVGNDFRRIASYFEKCVRIGDAVEHMPQEEHWNVLRSEMRKATEMLREFPRRIVGGVMQRESHTTSKERLGVASNCKSTAASAASVNKIIDSLLQFFDSLRRLFGDGVVLYDEDNWHNIVRLFANCTIVLGCVLCIMLVVAVWDAVFRRYVYYYFLQNGIILKFHQRSLVRRPIVHVVIYCASFFMIMSMFSNSRGDIVAPMLLSVVTLVKVLTGTFSLTNSLISLSRFVEGHELKRLQFLGECRVVTEYEFVHAAMQLEQRERDRQDMLDCVSDNSTLPPLCMDMCDMLDQGTYTNEEPTVSSVWFLNFLTSLRGTTLRKVDRDAGWVLGTGYILSYLLVFSVISRALNQ